jgi:hypothetical protein
VWQVSAYVPPGWPEAVQPPGTEGFVASAVSWLLDVTPPEWRQYPVLRRHPAALASMARYHAEACVEGARQGFRGARRELAEDVPPHAVDDVRAAYRVEGFKLRDTARGVELVKQALSGEAFTPKL